MDYSIGRGSPQEFLSDQKETTLKKEPLKPLPFSKVKKSATEQAKGKSEESVIKKTKKAGVSKFAEFTVPQETPPEPPKRSASKPLPHPPAIGKKTSLTDSIESTLQSNALPLLHLTPAARPLPSPPNPLNAPQPYDKLSPPPLPLTPSPPAEDTTKITSPTLRVLPGEKHGVDQESIKEAKARAQGIVRRSPAVPPHSKASIPVSKPEMRQQDALTPDNVLDKLSSTFRGACNTQAKCDCLNHLAQFIKNNPEYCGQWDKKKLKDILAYFQAYAISSKDIEKAIEEVNKSCNDARKKNISKREGQQSFQNVDTYHFLNEISNLAQGLPLNDRTTPRSAAPISNKTAEKSLTRRPKAHSLGPQSSSPYIKKEQMAEPIEEHKARESQSSGDVNLNIEKLRKFTDNEILNTALDQVFDKNDSEIVDEFIEIAYKKIEEINAKLKTIRKQIKKTKDEQTKKDLSSNKIALEGKLSNFTTAIQAVRMYEKDLQSYLKCEYFIEKNKNKKIKIKIKDEIKKIGMTNIHDFSDNDITILIDRINKATNNQSSEADFKAKAKNIVVDSNKKIEALFNLLPYIRLYSLIDAWEPKNRESGKEYNLEKLKRKRKMTTTHIAKFFKEQLAGEDIIHFIEEVHKDFISKLEQAKPKDSAYELKTTIGLGGGEWAPEDIKANEQYFEKINPNTGKDLAHFFKDLVILYRGRGADYPSYIKCLKHFLDLMENPDNFYKNYAGEIVQNVRNGLHDKNNLMKTTILVQNLGNLLNGIDKGELPVSEENKTKLKKYQEFFADPFSDDNEKKEKRNEIKELFEDTNFQKQIGMIGAL
jgi:hypothetical protein